MGFICYLRNNEANRVLATYLHQKETNTLVSSEQSLEIQGPKASKDDHLTDSGDNQKPLTPFLKRKTIEVRPFFIFSFWMTQGRSYHKWFDTHSVCVGFFNFHICQCLFTVFFFFRCIIYCLLLCIWCKILPLGISHSPSCIMNEFFVSSKERK